MQPAHIDLDIYKGSTFVKIIQWKTGETPVAVNLTGCTAVYDLEIIFLDTTVVRVIEGCVTSVPEVTR